MRFVTKVGDFATAAAAAASVALEKSSTPILTTALIKAGDHLTVTATDLDMWLAREVKAEIQDQGAVCVDAMKLRAFTSTLDNDEKLQGQITDGMLSLRSGRARCNLAMLPELDFPTFRVNDRFTHSVVLPTTLLREVIDRTAFSVSTDTTRHYLCGAFLSREGDDVIMVSSNGHVLTFVKLGDIDGADGMPGIIIPSATSSILRKNSEDAEIVTLDIGQSAIRAIAGKTTLVSKIIEGPYAEYRRAVPDEIEYPLVLRQSAFLTAVSRALSIAEAAKDRRGIWVRASRGIVTITGTAGAAEVEETLDAPDDARASFVCSGIYLRDALRAIGGEYIEIHQHPGNLALLLKQHDGNEDFVVVSGMRDSRVREEAQEEVQLRDTER